MAEGIDIEIIRYADNRPILDLCLGQPSGVISIIEEESKFYRSSSWTLIGSIFKHVCPDIF